MRGSFAPQCGRLVPLLHRPTEVFRSLDGFGVVPDMAENLLSAVFASAYGASFALQVHQYMQEGRGVPNEKGFQRFAEEAEAMEKLSEDVRQRF